MRGSRWRWVIGGAAVLALATARLSLKAQDRPIVDEPTRPGPRSASTVRSDAAACSVQDALERPFTLPFASPTRLDEVCRHLQRSLKAPVVLDIAALDRQDVRPDDTVQLELDGVRLKTGLKLLLDQVGLTYKVVSGDNLLVVTDRHGSDDPLDRVLDELRALHRDLHDVQDSVDDLRWTLGLEEDEGPRMRKPTIIEELPVPLQEDRPDPAEPAGPRPRSGI
jgi:hypothetical protein